MNNNLLKIIYLKVITTGVIFLFLPLGAVFFSCASTKTSVPAESPRQRAPERPVEIVPEGPVETVPERPEAADAAAILNAIAERLALNDYEGALALFDKIEPSQAGTTDIKLLRASILSSAGRLAEARTIAEGVISGEPENTKALFTLAALEGASGREREQRAILEGILQKDPVNVGALNALGTISLRNRSLRTASSYFDRALETEPENRDALIGRAGVYRYSRDPQNAEALLNRAITLYPQWAQARSERARLYREAGYPTQALADLDIAKKLDLRDYWIAVDRGNVLIDLNKKKEALEEFERAVELSPNTFLAYVYTAGIKDDLKDYDGAEEDYAILAKLKPEYYFAFEGLGMHKMRKGLWAAARDAFLAAYKQAPKEAHYALLAALNWIRAEKPAAPKQYLEQVLRGVQRESLEWYMLRLYHDFVGDNDLVIRVDREKNYDTKARMLFYLANYYDIRGNKSLADKYFLQVKELDRRAIPEWRLNEWALEARNLQIFQ